MSSAWRSSISGRRIGRWRRWCRRTRRRASHENAEEEFSCPGRGAGVVGLGFRRSSAKAADATARKGGVEEWVDGIAAGKAQCADGECCGDCEGGRVGGSGWAGGAGFYDGGIAAEGDEDSDGAAVCGRH